MFAYRFHQIVYRSVAVHLLYSDIQLLYMKRVLLVFRLWNEALHDQRLLCARFRMHAHVIGTHVDW